MKKPDRIGSGGLFIDVEYADEMVRQATIARWGEPRHAPMLRAARVAAAAADMTRRHLRDEIAEAKRTASGLGAKLAAGKIDLERYDEIVGPLDKRIAKLRAEAAAADAPPTADQMAHVDDAAAAWAEAEEAGDLSAMRAMVQVAFPNLALTPATQIGRSGPERFDWQGASLATLA